MIEIIVYVLIITLWILVKNLKSARDTNRTFRAGDVITIGETKMRIESYHPKDHMYWTRDMKGDRRIITEELVKFTRTKD